MQITTQITPNYIGIRKENSPIYKERAILDAEEEIEIRNFLRDQSSWSEDEEMSNKQLNYENIEGIY